MRFPRSSGILLHPTCLPAPGGIGDFGAEAFAFVDFLKDAGQRLWQVLPLNPTGYADSPFQCFSAHAGNHLLISLENLRGQGILEAADFRGQPEFPQERVDFGRVIEWKTPLLKKAAARFLSSAIGGDRKAFEDFRAANASWLPDFALFMACKEEQGGVAWNKWPRDIAQRTAPGLSSASTRLKDAARAVEYWQFEFFRQWQQLRSYARQAGIRVIGDIPIYVALDSADVWTDREYFQLSEDGQPLKIAGVPPDYFSATGQCWGNPIYRWDRLKQSGYRWWVERFRAALELYDGVRIDHFRGFEAYWEIPGSETTAINGQWVKGPGGELFAALERKFGELPIIAENLGVITPEVEAIRERFHFPGMAILQFAFGKDPQGPSFRPHNYARQLAAYTGTHDNDTTLGWYSHLDAGAARLVDLYLGTSGAAALPALLRLALGSVARLSVIPMQDLLGLGSEARLNTPGTVSGNWSWRLPPAALTPELARRYAELNAAYGRT